MRRTIALLTTMAMTLLVATSVAMAVTKTCSYSGSCTGTNYNDTLYGGAGNNTIYGQSGDDFLYGNPGEDDLYGSSGADYMSGGSDFDRLFGGSGDDRMYGGDGSSPDYYVGEGGNDWMVDYGTVNSDIYRFYFREELDILTRHHSGSDQMRDDGGSSDRLYFNYSTRDELLITWVDTSDAGVYRDALRIQDKDDPTQSVLVYNYFNNLGGTGRGSGAIEFIHFGPDIGGSFVGFPAPPG